MGTRLVVGLMMVAGCAGSAAATGSRQQGLTQDVCAVEAVGNKVTFCHRSDSSDPGVTITTAVQACVNGHAANHTADTIGPCESLPSCAVSGSIHSSEGHVFDQVTLAVRGYDFADGSSLYDEDPWMFFADAGMYQHLGFPPESTPYLPLECGAHDLTLHSIDRESCNTSPDEICFSNWSWWSREPVTSPSSSGIEIPVGRVSGHVRTEAAVPVAGALVNALGGFPPFSFVQNSTVTSAEGRYDFALLPGMEWQIEVSVGDTHPMNLDSASQLLLVAAGNTLDFRLAAGPARCPFSGTVRTSAGVALESIDSFHFGFYYGLTGWRFGSIEPGTFFRYPNTSVILDNIPLICGHQETHEPNDWLQDFYINSIQDATRPSCVTRSDQPCLEFWSVAQSFSLLNPMTDDIVIPVVEIDGTITRIDGTAIAGASIDIRAEICDDAACTSTRGVVSNHAITGSDGRYELAVVPSEHSNYTITISSGTAMITLDRVFTADTTVDAQL